MSDVSRRLFLGAAAGSTAVAVAMVDGNSAQADYLGTRLRLSVRDLGVVADGVADDGAILTKGLADALGTYATTGPRQVPVEVDFGDLTLHLKTPIIINQNFIEFVGSPKFFCDVVPNAIVINAGGEIATVFGVKIKGTFEGHVEGDAILYQQGSQGEIDVRNNAYVAGAVVHVQGCYRNDIRVQTKGEGITCYHAYREGVLRLGSALYNTINSNIFVVAYDCYGAAVLIEESQGFDLRGDIERAVGPGVDLYNCQNGIIEVYTEKNGLGASNSGYDTPDDIRIRSGPGLTVAHSDGLIIRGSRIGGEAIVIGGRQVTPNSVHVIDAYRTFIEGNAVGGNISLEQNSRFTTVGSQGRMLGQVLDAGVDTVDQSLPGRQVVKRARYRRLVIDGTANGGAKVGSDDNLLRLYGLSSFGTGATLANNFTGFVDIAGAASSGRVSFPVPEVDANYTPMVSLLDLSGASESAGCKIRNVTPQGFDVVLSAAPGAGQAIRAHYLIVRTS